MGAMHVQAVMDSSNKGFMIYMFSIHHNLSMQSNCPSDKEVHIIVLEQCLGSGLFMRDLIDVRGSL